VTTPDFTLACLRLQAVKEGFAILVVPISRTDDPSSQYSVSDHFDITLEDFRAREYKSEYNPLVILNACCTGTMSPLYTANWAALFWEYGARGVLATEFHVPDWFAADFIEVLYSHFLSGMPIGESLWATRCYFWKERSNPLGLAYALYGPLAIRIVHSTVEKEVHERG
jgi:CHAT domain